MSDQATVNIFRTEPLLTPEKLKQLLPLTSAQRSFIKHSRQAIIDILEGRSDRLLLVVGPCSIHDTIAANDYAKKLRQLADHVESRIQIVMRAYFEKPRTGLGWKGLLYDPGLDGTNDLNLGLHQSRQLLLNLAEMRIATATEFLDLTSPHYLCDLVSWASIGSRTTESQPHRQMASALPLATGFKNGTDGNINVAINALMVAQAPHTFIGLDDEGQISLVRSKGNPHCHIVLRGGSGQPNYDRLSIQTTLSILKEKGLATKVLIDCSHDNSGKDPYRQTVVFGSVIDQILEGNRNIMGVMIESNLLGGSQKHGSPGNKPSKELSITDPCLDWASTEEVVLWAFKMLKEHN